MKAFVISLLLFTIFTMCSPQGEQAYNISTIYKTDGEWIEGHNLDRYNNRPIYINNGKGIILTGDKPLIRLALNNKILGNFVLSLKRGKDFKKIYDFDQITSSYAAGQMKWEISDSNLKDVGFILNVLPAANGTGMVVQLTVKKLREGDELNWCFGGGKLFGRSVNYEFDLMGHPEMIDWKDVDSTEELLFQGELSGKQGDVFTLSFKLDSQRNVNFQTGRQAEEDLLQAKDKLERIVGRMKINTPDPYLDAIAEASVFAVDGTWYPPAFVHGGMLWNYALPGWRTVFGGTMYGWHDRVLEQAKYYIASQVKESDKNTPKADSSGLMTLQHANSRFYGVGRITKDQKRYNMQSQLFDQLIEDYRWTSDPELIKVLREALELHLVWLKDCFDPDDDGVYESYLNSWPTDSQWYNGGGTAEETSYAYRAHIAARDMARNAGDNESEGFHNHRIEKIRKGFFEKMWIASKGHPGAYREQGGNERLHENPWLYSIFFAY